jgi:hypothetical protein
LYALIGVWPPRSSAAAAVITLAVEPGSKMSCTARFLASATVLSVVWS